MSILTVRSSFVRGLGSKGNVHSCTMKYSPDRTKEVLTIVYVPAGGGSAVTIVDETPAGGDLAARAYTLGQEAT